MASSSPSKKTIAVKLIDIRLDGGTQQRAEINTDIVAEYAEAMKCGHKFPPITLFFDSAQYWLADGFHRFYACRSAEMLDVLSDVYEGISRDAVLFSAGANSIHGLRPSNADKRKAVLMLLNDNEWAKWANKQIARHCHVSDTFVSKLRDEQYPTKPKGQTFAPTKESGILKPTPGPIPENENSEDHYNPEAEALANAHETVIALSEENQALRDAIASGNLPAADQGAGEIIIELRARVKTLEATLAAVESTRDTLLNENAALKKQCLAQARKLKKIEGKGNV